MMAVAAQTQRALHRLVVVVVAAAAADVPVPQSVFLFSRLFSFHRLSLKHHPFLLVFVHLFFLYSNS